MPGTSPFYYLFRKALSIVNSFRISSISELISVLKAQLWMFPFHFPESVYNHHLIPGQKQPLFSGFELLLPSSSNFLFWTGEIYMFCLFTRKCKKNTISSCMGSTDAFHKCLNCEMGTPLFLAHQLVENQVRKSESFMLSFLSFFSFFRF